MINQNSESESGAGTTAERAGARQKHCGTSGGLATFIWRRENKARQECKGEDTTNDARTMEQRFRNPSSSKVSFGFFRNIKKHLPIKSLCKTKQKSKETEAVSSSPTTNQNAVISVNESPNSCQGQEALSDEQSLPERRLGDILEITILRNTEENVINTSMQYSDAADTNLRVVSMGQQDEATHNIATSDAIPIVPVKQRNRSVAIPAIPVIPVKQRNRSDSGATVAVPSLTEVPGSANEILSNENKVKASLAKELLNLSKYGWYWGPISGDEADAKLISEPDGAFLVRDSSDDRYVLTLSFKSSGKMLHARMEHSGGLFSLCNQCTESKGFTSVAALINHSMNFSQSSVICYSRPKYPGYPSFPVRLTKPVSRFTQVRSLQYLCRFVIRQNTRLDNIHKLPLPKTIKGYIQEAHY